MGACPTQTGSVFCPFMCASKLLGFCTLSYYIIIRVLAASTGRGARPAGCACVCAHMTGRELLGFATSRNPSYRRLPGGKGGESCHWEGVVM
jgi:hypothetical protein